MQVVKALVAAQRRQLTVGGTVLRALIVTASNQPICMVTVTLRNYCFH